MIRVNSAKSGLLRQYMKLGPCPSRGALVSGVGLLSHGSKEVKTQMCLEIISPEFDQQVGEKKCVPGCLGNYMAIRHIFGCYGNMLVSIATDI